MAASPAVPRFASFRRFRPARSARRSAGLLAPWLVAMALRSVAKSPGWMRGAAALAVAALAVGCTPAIGDKCATSNDCGIKGDRVCDTSQPGGYCTQTGCSRGTCPKHAACILFNTRVPGCGYNDRVVSRFANTACMAVCSDNGDCRDGYVCRNPATAPWMAFTMEDVTQSVCIAEPPAATLAVSDADSTAPICGPGTGFAVTSGDAGNASVDDAGATPDGGQADAALPGSGVDGGADAAADAG